MEKLIAFAVIASLLCGCVERAEDYVRIVDNSRPGEPSKKIPIPEPLVYDRYEYSIAPTGAVVVIYFTPEKSR